MKQEQRTDGIIHMDRQEACSFLDKRHIHSHCKGPEVHVSLAWLKMSNEAREAGEG